MSHCGCSVTGLADLPRTCFCESPADRLQCSFTCETILIYLTNTPYCYTYTKCNSKVTHLVSKIFLCNIALFRHTTVSWRRKRSFTQITQLFVYSVKDCFVQPVFFLCWDSFKVVKIAISRCDPFSPTKKRTAMQNNCTIRGMLLSLE